MPRKTPPGKTVDISSFSNILYTMSTVNTKESRYGSHPDYYSAITIAAFQRGAIGNKVENYSVTESDVNEIFMSGLFPSLFELYTQEDFNIYISTDKTINRNIYMSCELC